MTGTEQGLLGVLLIIGIPLTILLLNKFFKHQVKKQSEMQKLIAESQAVLDESWHMMEMRKMTRTQARTPRPGSRNWTQFVTIPNRLYEVIPSEDDLRFQPWMHQQYRKLTGIQAPVGGTIALPGGHTIYMCNEEGMWLRVGVMPDHKDITIGSTGGFVYSNIVESYEVGGLVEKLLDAPDEPEEEPKPKDCKSIW